MTSLPSGPLLEAGHIDSRRDRITIGLRKTRQTAPLTQTLGRTLGSLVGRTQTSFLAEFTSGFQTRTGLDVTWAGGQVVANTAALPFNEALRRPGPVKKVERFELGDIAANVGGCRVVIEFESAEVPLSNLLKYWPYIRGDLATRPSSPIVICHFSDWWSYATRRDLWEWTLARMKADPERVVEVEGRQFDHWGDDQERRSRSMHAAIDWIIGVIGLSSEKA